MSTSYEHDAHREDLLGVGVGRHVAETHAGEAAEGEVEWSDVDAVDGRTTASRVNFSNGVVWWLQSLPQLVEPSCFLDIKMNRNGQADSSTAT